MNKITLSTKKGQTDQDRWLSKTSSDSSVVSEHFSLDFQEFDASNQNESIYATNKLKHSREVSVKGFGFLPGYSIRLIPKSNDTDLDPDLFEPISSLENTNKVNELIDELSREHDIEIEGVSGVKRYIRKNPKIIEIIHDCIEKIRGYFTENLENIVISIFNYPEGENGDKNLRIKINSNQHISEALHTLKNLEQEWLFNQYGDYLDKINLDI